MGTATAVGASFLESWTRIKRCYSCPDVPRRTTRNLAEAGKNQMLKKLLLPVILLVLTLGFWASSEFQEIAAGVAIFLFGMLMLEDGFKLFSGGALERVLDKTTDTVPKSLGFGFVAATVMQSSSLVSVITISFLSAGLIRLIAGIGIMFGADIGTTTGAWLVAGFGLKVNISAYAMPLLAISIVLVFQKSKYVRGFGLVLAGLGFLFLGIHHMKEGFDTFKDQLDLRQFAMTGALGLIVYTAIGATATVVMQSSHATMVLIITAMAAGQVSYENAIALVIGANVGTTITAVIAALTANYLGRRLALAHVIFKLVTAVVSLLLIGQLVWTPGYSPNRIFGSEAGRFRCLSPLVLRVGGNVDGDDHGRPHLGSAI
jgi:phosphate:Na+ symporter